MVWCILNCSLPSNSDSGLDRISPGSDSARIGHSTTGWIDSSDWTGSRSGSDSATDSGRRSAVGFVTSGECRQLTVYPSLPGLPGIRHIQTHPDTMSHHHVQSSDFPSCLPLPFALPRGHAIGIEVLNLSGICKVMGGHEQPVLVF